jgi:hypothetical protein
MVMGQLLRGGQRAGIVRRVQSHPVGDGIPQAVEHAADGAGIPCRAELPPLLCAEVGWEQPVLVRREL